MNPAGFSRLRVAILASPLAFTVRAEADALEIVTTQPKNVRREVARLEVIVVGTGFGVNPSVRFLIAGSDNLGGVVVNTVRLQSPTELIAVVDIDPAAAPGAYDIEVRGASGDKARTRNALVVEPYSWATRFGCSGAESWRRRVPCRRGSTD
jgi:hypothetical protein